MVEHKNALHWLSLQAFILSSALLATGTKALADPAEGRPHFHPDGTASVPAFELPPSLLSSPSAQEAMRVRAAVTIQPAKMEPDIAKSRAGLAMALAPKVAQITAAFPVDVTEDEIAGVPVRRVTAKNQSINSDSILINLHGGAFNTCWESCSIIESAPIAVTTERQVISVNYRMAPEFKHPAGVDDVLSVYQALLQDYGPEQIGIFGCSAGGALTAQTAAALVQNSLPLPAGIGIFGAGGVRFTTGDSSFIAGNIDGSFPPPNVLQAMGIDLTRGYFDGIDYDDPIVSPALHPEVMAGFPPTLLITGTRAMDMSPSIVTHSALLNADADSQLIVGEGMGHCYIYSPDLQEAQDAYQVIARFFDRRLR
jgi:monoterpene epsilon-lactone hydrolase